MKYKIQDLIDMDKFQSLQDHLSSIYPFPSAIIDNEGVILTATAWQDICTKFHRQNKECEKECILSDQYILQHLDEADPAVSYQCPHGLIDNAMPIIVDGEHLANFFTGQFFLEAPDLDFFRDQAAKFGFDEEAYLEAVKRVPIWNRRQLNHYLLFIKEMIQVISSIGLKNLQEIETTKAMQKSEVKYRSLFEQAGDYILVLSVADNRDILIVNANQAAFSTHGYTRDEFLGLSINELDRSLDEDQLRSTFDRVLAGEAVRFETTRARKDGSVFPVEVSCSLLSTSDDSPLITSIERDITERVQAEEEARKFKTIFDNSNSGCVIADLAGHIEYTNSYMSAIHGYTPEELLGAPLTIFHSEKQMEVVRDFLPSMLKNSSFGPLEVGHTHRDGTEFPMMMTGFIMEGDSKSHRYMVVTAIDITREAELEKQLHQAKRLETVGQLAGGVAHDFNNLLHVIRGFTDIAFSDLDPNNPAIASLEEVTKATQRASNLVNQLLAFSRRQVLEMSDVDLNAVIKNMMKMVARIIGEHIKVDLRIGPDLSVIRADPGQIELILMNLCVNARDAMPSGGVLTIETGVVSLGEAFCQTNALEKTGPYAVVGVQDTGCGIKAADLEKIFEPFYTTKEVGRGTGLGLSTVYGLIKQHHGLIRAQSETGKGTTFTIHLPLINRPAAKEVKKNMDSIPRGRETLLVAEDDPAILKLLKTLLERSGYTVFTADNGEEALRVFREKAGSLDLVLLDVMMPKLSGREVYDTIQKEQPGMKVVFSSGYSLGGVHTSFVLDEGLHFIRKPCPSEDLLRKIRSVLEAAN